MATGTDSSASRSLTAMDGAQWGKRVVSSKRVKRLCRGAARHSVESEEIITLNDGKNAICAWGYVCNSAPTRQTSKPKFSHANIGMKGFVMLRVKHFS